MSRITTDIRFVGLFDTVAARGILTDPGSIRDLFRLRPSGTPSDRLRVDWSKVQGSVRQAVAAQEFRSTFDLISLRGCENCDLPNNVREEIFPGAHSNVGGGYGTSQGGNPLAVYPLSYMYTEAVDSGVPLSASPELRVANLGLYDNFFELTNLAHDSRFPNDRVFGKFERSIYFGGASGRVSDFDVLRMLQQALESAKRIDPLFIHEGDNLEDSEQVLWSDR